MRAFHSPLVLTVLLLLPIACGGTDSPNAGSDDENGSSNGGSGGTVTNGGTGSSGGSSIGSASSSGGAVTSSSGGAVTSSSGGVAPGDGGAASDGGAADGGGTTDGGGACVPPTDVEVCAHDGARCGSQPLVDACGTPRTIDCGSCSNGRVCGFGPDGTNNGIPGRCGTFQDMASLFPKGAEDVLEIFDIWGAGNDDVYFSARVNGVAKLGYWNGVRMSVASKITERGYYFRTIHGSDANNVVALSGRDFQGGWHGIYGARASWSGFLFEASTTPSDSVFSFSDSSAVAVGAGGTSRFSQGAWVHTAGAPLRVVWGWPASGTAIAAGVDSVVRFDGTSWAPTAWTSFNSTGSGHITSVWGAAEDDVWLATGLAGCGVGTCSYVYHSKGNPLVGSSWVVRQFEGVNSNYYEFVRGSKADDVWAASTGGGINQVLMPSGSLASANIGWAGLARGGANRNISALWVNPNYGDIWVGGPTGLVRFVRR